MTAPSEWVFSANGQSTLTVRNSIAGSNEDGVTDVEIRLRRKVQPNRFNISAESKVAVQATQNRLNSSSNQWKTGTQIATVGSHVSFYHRIGGYNGATNQRVDVAYSVYRNPSNAGYSGALDGSGSLIHHNTGGKNRNHGDLVRVGYLDNGSLLEAPNNKINRETFRVTQDMMGKTICENLSYLVNGRANGNNDSSLYHQNSTAACVYVPYDYELTPCVSASDVPCGGRDIPADPGTSLDFDPKITSGGTNSKPNTRWIITTWSIAGVAEGAITPNSDIKNSSSDTCNVYNEAYGGRWYARSIQNCDNSQQGSRTFEAGKTTNPGDPAKNKITIPEDAPLGTRYCMAISVSPYLLTKNEDAATQAAKENQWRHSAPLCLMATKKPKTQIWGNGFYARGGIRTSSSNYSSKGQFGSWVEYEAISGGLISGFTSESSNTTNHLTFKNGSTDKGNWGSWEGATNTSNIISNIRSRFPSSSNGVLVESINGNYGGWNGATRTDVHTHIINSNGMFLSGNITSKNPTSATSLKSFQQTIIIVDGDLYISKDVQQIDAWLIVTGKIVTCATGQVENPAIVNQANCGQNLQVNGPVISGTLKSWRTGGSDFNNPSAASEVYNQRADVYLWAYNQASSDGKVMTTYTKELPVRY
ncbi:MAG: hypothetical protein Q4A27_02940 [bacterium]|nr:hypothetical protein [bacterium]